jgi:hypothetical protein
VVCLFGLYCVCWFILDCTVCGAFVWTVLCVACLFGL